MAGGHYSARYTLSDIPVSLGSSADEQALLSSVSHFVKPNPAYSKMQVLLTWERVSYMCVTT